MTTVFFDLETSGLDKERHAIIQLAAAAVDNKFAVIDTFHKHIKFKVSAADPKALLMNAYEESTWAELAESPRLVANDLLHFLNLHATNERKSKNGRMYKTCTVAGHNIDSFDVPFLRHWFKRLGHDWTPIDYQTLDTLCLARWRDFVYRSQGQQYAHNLKLATLCEFYEIDLVPTHDAMADVQANVLLANAMLSDCESWQIGRDPEQADLFGNEPERATKGAYA